MGENTRNALRRFQSSQGLSQTGYLDLPTLDALGVTVDPNIYNAVIPSSRRRGSIFLSSVAMSSWREPGFGCGALNGGGGGKAFRSGANVSITRLASAVATETGGG